MASASGGQADRNASWATPSDDVTVLDVGGEQSPRHEGVQLRGSFLGQLVPANPQPGGAALLINRHQSKQVGDHLILRTTRRS